MVLCFDTQSPGCMIFNMHDRTCMLVYSDLFRFETKIKINWKSYSIAIFIPKPKQKCFPLPQQQQVTPYK